MKKFKAIIALAAALAISISSMGVASAAAGSSNVSYNGTSFGAIDPVPIQLTVNNIYSVEVSWGNFALQYSFKDTAGNGWGNSFDNVNNAISVTNKSTIPVDITYTLDIDTETYPELSVCGFQLTNAGGSPIDGPVELTYTGDTTSGKFTSSSVYLNPKTDLTADEMRPLYNLDNAEIGNITVAVAPHTT